MNRYQLHKARPTIEWKSPFKVGDLVIIKNVPADRIMHISDPRGYVDAIFAPDDIRVITYNDFNAYHWKPEELDHE